jgi:glycosyltransferase involved in cell wall biosynthesis
LGVDVSVLIPTYQRARKLAACVGSLARQAGDVSFEVLVGLDGRDDDSEQAAKRAWAAFKPWRERELRVIDCGRGGYTKVRKHLLSLARGQVMLSLNDDVVAETELIASHWREHERRRTEELGRAIVVGDAPYVKRPAGELDSMLDRLVRETPMVFFYDVMNSPEGLADRDRDWGFRHCFGLNFSADLACVREVGGFLARPHVYGYDDIELGWKLATRFGMPVIYRPEARVRHEHFYTAQDLMGRERALGKAAWEFAGANPEFAKAVFGRDVRSREEVEYSREFVRREQAAAQKSQRTLEALETVPSSAIDGPHAGTLLRALYEQHLLLKRWNWRCGLLEMAGGKTES